VRLTQTLIWYLGQSAEAHALVSLFKLAVVALCTDQRKVASSVLGTKLVRIVRTTVDHLWVVVVPLGVYLVAKVLLVNLRIWRYHLWRISLKALDVLIVSRGYYCLFWILRRNVVVLIPLS
jgi:hypothetical protein